MLTRLNAARRHPCVSGPQASGLGKQVAPARPKCAAPQASSVSRVAPAGPQCGAPQAGSVSRVAAAGEAVTSQVLYFHSVTLRYVCVTLALRPIFYSVTLRYPSLVF